MQTATVEIALREIDHAVLLDISAENFTYPQTGILKTHVAQLLERGYRGFVLNCHDVKLVDSYGLATIVASFKMIKEHGGFLTLYGLNDMFVHLVKVTHLDRILEVWPTEAQALYYLSIQSKTTSKSS